MTASFAPDDLWRTMPGWGITANLLPPEIVTARRTKVLRKFALSAIVFVMLLGIAGYFYALSQKDDANAALQAAQTQTAVLHTQQAKYSEVVTISGQISTITSQLAQVLAGDVDMTALVGKIVSAQPGGGTITQLQVQISADPLATPTSTGAGVLDTSGRTHVGTLTLTASTRSLADVASYVVRLNKIPGVVTAFPSSVTSSDRSVTYTIQATLTDQVFSHKYDQLATGAGSTQGGH